MSFTLAPTPNSGQRSSLCNYFSIIIIYLLPASYMLCVPGEEAEEEEQQSVSRGGVGHVGVQN